MFCFKAAHPETGEALEVEAVYFPAWRGLRDEFGVPTQPDDTEALHICAVRDREGEPVEYEAFRAALEAEGFAVACEKR